MSIEAMKQALEALRNAEVVYMEQLNAMYALQQAIEFAEMVEKGTKAWANTPDGWVDDLRGGVEIVASDHTNSHQQELTDRQLLQQVLRFLQQVIAYSNEEMARLDALKKLVRERLAQPEPEPVAWAGLKYDSTPMLGINKDLMMDSGAISCWPLYECPPKREWVEIQYVSQHDSPVEYNIAEAVAWAVGYNQAIDKLKEQNG
jgi:hypothetical protein